MPAAITKCIQTQVAGINMTAVVMGRETLENNPVFVLVHGLGMSSRYMMPTAERLAALGVAYAPDLPGFGKSGKPPRTSTIPELADFLAGWIDAMDLSSPILIGNSLGAQVIVDLAVRHPSRLSAAVLAGPTIDSSARSASAQVWRLLKDIPREPPRLYGIAASDYLRAGAGRCLRTLAHALRDPIVEKLRQIHVPVLVVRGEHDPIAPQQWTEKVAESIPQAKWVTLPHVAHAVNFSAAEDFVNVILDFCREESCRGLRS